MIKKLVFYFYVTRENINAEINKIHFACLKEYINIFDEVFFTISVDDTEDYELIKELETRIINLYKKGNIVFEIQKNDDFRECTAFKKHVIDKLGEKKLVFFAHNKGTSNQQFNQECIKKWILGMYFYNLETFDEARHYLLICSFLSYGAFLTSFEKRYKTKYKWIYAGTFFWINSASLLNRINQFDVKIPEIDNRFYAEDFLGNIFPCWPEPLAASHNLRYWYGNIDMYDNTEATKMYYPEEEGFNDFTNKILNAINETNE